MSICYLPLRETTCGVHLGSVRSAGKLRAWYAACTHTQKAILMSKLGIPLAWWFGVAGLVLGMLLSWWLATLRATKREERLINAAREQIAQSAQSLRNVNAKLQAELDKERALGAQGQTSALSEQRSLVLHLQSQLRAANMEMDRLQRSSPVVTPSRANEHDDSDGFALTRPLRR